MELIQTDQQNEKKKRNLESEDTFSILLIIYENHYNGPRMKRWEKELEKIILGKQWLKFSNLKKETDTKTNYNLKSKI